jgi:hypothetical protein
LEVVFEGDLSRSSSILGSNVNYYFLFEETGIIRGKAIATGQGCMGDDDQPVLLSYLSH